MSDSVVALIPARGGSKGLPGKNLRELGGRSLLRRAVECAKEVDRIEKILVSTDDLNIATEAERSGAQVIWRPADLATDESLVIETVRHAYHVLRTRRDAVEVMVLLQPTSPLRSATDVDHCLDRLFSEELDCVATFTEALLHPYQAWRITPGTRPYRFFEDQDPWVRRQDLADAYQLNGAVYTFRTTVLQESTGSLLQGKCGAVIMPKWRSIDIDEEVDLQVARGILGDESG